VKPNRLAFLSKPLRRDLHVSGTPELRLRASASTSQTNLGAILVDYGAATHQTRAGDGVVTTGRSSCWGETSATDDPCYFEVDKPLVDVTSWGVSKGILDSSNRYSLSTAVPLQPGRRTSFRLPLLPTDYVFPAGHRIGVIVVGSYADFPSNVNGSRATISVDVRRSRIALPITFERAEPAPGAQAPLVAPESAGDGGWDNPRERRIPR
jgi:X-Pro dipeptidyl-peptidase